MLHSKTEEGVDMATVKSSSLSETAQNPQPLLPSSPTLETFHETLKALH